MLRAQYISEAKEMKGKVRIGGWVHDFRDLGKLKFVYVRDITGIIQVTMKKGIVDDELLKRVSVNKEDVVIFEGELKENKIAQDGVELIPTDFELLNSVERRLPVDPTGKVPSDPDTLMDFRYLDLRVPKTTAVFKIKSLVSGAFREKLKELQFTEIQPSAITGAATEGGTDVFPIQYFENKAYLVQSPQLYKQLAVIGGFDRVMMTVPVFRAEKHNTSTHLNEITQMDIEIGFANHNDAMEILEKVVLHILLTVKKQGANELKTAGAEINVPKKINRYTYSEMVEKLNNAGFKMKKN